MHVNKRKVLVGAAVAVGLAVATGLGASPVSAAPASHFRIQKTLAGDFVGPLQIAVGDTKTYVADSFAGQLFQVGSSKPLATGPIDGVAVNRATGDIAYTASESDGGGPESPITAAHLFLRHAGVTRSVDTLAFEKQHNPDSDVTYGVVGNANSCAKNFFARISGHPATYRGVKDSHPYAVTALSNGDWAVADAAANDVLRVTPQGKISVLAVLPAQPVTITQQLLNSMGGGPSCVVGVRYRFESVPTDVELGPGGLYVSLLPGSEIPGQGKVYKMDVSGRHLTLLAGGFSDAVNLAVASTGDVFVAELGQDIKLIRHGVVSTAMTLPGVVALEWAHGHLYASTAPALTGAMDPGHVYRLVQA